MTSVNGDETGGFGRQVTADTVRIERVLPGPRERIWRYLTEPELRRKWLAAGAFELSPSGDVELVFRNSELTANDDPPPARFADAGGEVRLVGVITVCAPTEVLAYTWGAGDDASEVRFDLVDEGSKVRLTVTHTRLANRDMRVMVSAGWHTHLDLLVAVLEERAPDGFWRRFATLERAYEDRLPRA
ncbi:SRPBCC family protein [Chthonobacter albigriseus]|uniref:SRPBCC family protein n=1 Tax=Chthonobacter albigriseus TaxID=1683161 RepID=UPI0015EE511F|nr:SRPBCC family protein [Chthonobacter albigriseus]